jgi:hypothetical protein
MRFDLKKVMVKSISASDLIGFSRRLIYWDMDMASHPLTDSYSASETPYAYDAESLYVLLLSIKMHGRT